MVRTQSLILLNRRKALVAGLAAGAPAAAAPVQLPTVKWGKYTLSRLIVGGNPISGHSHSTAEVSREMIDYFTASNAKKLLARCEQAGINVWQSRGDAHIVRLLHEYRLEGGKLHWIAQTASELGDIPGHIRRIAASARPIGIYNHGNNTDGHWRKRTMEVVRDQCKAMRDASVMVGVGTHIPEVIDYVESQGWDVDFYMTCLYNMRRSKEEARKLAGRQVEGEYFHHPDREEMLKRVRQASKPCLIFKVYAAGRNCGSAEQMLSALRLAFQYAKPTDAVVIGMFPKYKEQVNENCRLVVEAIHSVRPS